MSVEALPTQPYLWTGACTINTYYSKYVSRVFYGKNAIPEIVAPYAMTSDVIIALGHGIPCEITLQDEKTFISYKDKTSVMLPSGRSACSEDKNLDLLPGKYIHFISCYTADGLGKLAIESGAKAYLGSSNEFIFLVDACSYPAASFYIAEASTIPYLVKKDPYNAQRNRLMMYDYFINEFENMGGYFDYIALMLEYDKSIAVLLTPD